MISGIFPAIIVQVMLTSCTSMLSAISICETNNLSNQNLICTIHCHDLSQQLNFKNNILLSQGKKIQSKNFLSPRRTVISVESSMCYLQVDCLQCQLIYRALLQGKCGVCSARKWRYYLHHLHYLHYCQFEHGSDGVMVEIITLVEIIPPLPPNSCIQSLFLSKAKIA